MKNKHYFHIQKSERLEISILLGRGYSLREIAEVLGYHVSSISREIKNNSTSGVYDPIKASHKAYVKRKYAKYEGMKIIENKESRDYVEEKLEEGWSPEQISGRAKEIDTHIPYTSFRVIYKFIKSPYGRLLEKRLRYKGKKRKTNSNQKVSQLQDRVFIDQRPKIIDKRRRFGDWEGDFIVSGKNGKGALLVFHERKGKYILIKKLKTKSIELVHQYFYELTRGVVVNSFTLDNDIVFKKHKELSELLGAPVYFCHPYHSWEKGGVENANKLIRQYIPKGSDIFQYSDEYIKMIQDKLNNRPRKCLKFKTPLEVMKENNQLKEEINDTMKINLWSQNKKIPSVALGGSM